MIKTTATQLRDDSEGSALVEFGFVAPIFFLMMMAFFDLGYGAYVNAQLQGLVEKAARDGALESGPAALSSLDARVRNQTQMLALNAEITFDRKNYTSFTRAGAQEKFTDSNANNIRDPGECFQDENANGVWDADSGASGQGGAEDITRYTVTAKYNRIFPMWGMLGFDRDQTLIATTVLRNQPYDSQAVRTPTVVCT
jgi:Flp pilus assembly protein TadG